MQNAAHSDISDKGDNRPTPGEMLPQEIQQTIPIPPSKPVLNREDLNTNRCVDYKKSSQTYNSYTTIQVQAIEEKVTGDDTAAAAGNDDDADNDDDDGEGKCSYSFLDSKRFTNQEIKSRNFTRF